MTRRTRRNHTPAFKANVTLAAFEGDKTLAELAKLRSSPEPIHHLEGAASGGAAGVFSPGWPASDVEPVASVTSTQLPFQSAS